MDKDIYNSTIRHLKMAAISHSLAFPFYTFLECLMYGSGMYCMVLGYPHHYLHGSGIYGVIKKPRKAFLYALGH